MYVDSAVELGRDDPALEIPWVSQDGSLRYFNIRANPALIDALPEAAWVEMRKFLIRANAADFPLQTAKSDVWTTTDISPEEEIFSAGWKFASYVDLLFSAEEQCFSLPAHQQLVKKLCALLARAPDMPASMEFVVRHCYYHGLGAVVPVRDSKEGGQQQQLQPLAPDATLAPDTTLDDSQRGFYLTLYVSGFGNTKEEARQPWSIALKLLQHALIQVVRL